ncbi:MAG: hypothetical protein WC043_04770 [Pseudobdellovibrionaceae bacterium]
MSIGAISTHRVTPVVEIIPSGGNDNNPAEDSERKRPYHLALALQFSLGGHAENGSPEVIENESPESSAPDFTQAVQDTSSFVSASRLRAMAGPIDPRIAIQMYQQVQALK